VKSILATAVCVSVCTDPDVTWRNGRGCYLVGLCWADFQLVHGFRCYNNIHAFKLIALYTANAYSEMSASACTRSTAGYLKRR